MRLLLLTLLCSPLIACGPQTPANSGGGGGGGGGGGEITLESAMDAYSAAICDRIARCYDAQQAAMVAVFFAMGGDEMLHRLGGGQECKALYKREMQASLQPVMETGRLIINPSGAEACAAAISAFDCAELPGPLTACNDFIAPQQQEGDPCGHSLECVTQICSAERGQCGSCITAAQIGEACTPRIPCVAEATCDMQTERCVAKSTPIATGESCETSFLDLTGNCANRMELCIDGRCTAVTMAALGEACGETNDGIKTCEAGSVCIGSVCVSEPTAVGQACMEPDGGGGDTPPRTAICPPASRCDRSSSTCVALGTEGDACRTDGDCDRQGFYCEDRTACTAKKDTDEDCEAENECLSDACIDNGCAPAVALTCQ